MVCCVVTDAAPATALLATPRKALSLLSQKPLASQPISVKPIVPSRPAQEDIAELPPSAVKAPASAPRYNYLDIAKQVSLHAIFEVPVGKMSCAGLCCNDAHEEFCLIL